MLKLVRLQMKFLLQFERFLLLMERKESMQGNFVQLTQSTLTDCCFFSLRYESKLDDARIFGIKKSVINGFVVGFLWLVINGGYSLGFWYGWKLTTEINSKTGESQYTVGTILIVFFAIIIAVFSLGNAAPFFGTLTSSRTAAKEIFNIINRVSTFKEKKRFFFKQQTFLGAIY